MLCRAAVAARLKKVPGVIAYDVDLKSDSATVLYDPAKANIEGLREAVAQAGFPAKSVEEIDK